MGGGAGARPDQTDLRGTRRGDHTGSSIAGSRTPVDVGTAFTITGETGAVHQRTVKPTSAGGIPGVAKTILGTAHVGAGVLLCDGGRGRRGNDQSLYREPEVGRRRSGFQNHRAYRALSRL